MMTRTELHDLITATPDTAVSLYLPTHTTGREVRQDPIRLKNLLTQARVQLADRGVADPDTMLEPASALLDDGVFWADRRAGLAVFIDREQTRQFSLPLVVTESVVVGEGFAVRQLLPMLDADQRFAVLTVTERASELRLGSRFSVEDETVVELPEHPLRSGVESDYQNPVNASPPNRPNVGAHNIGNAQVYGDSPPEFRKAQLLAYAGALAKTVEAWLAKNPMPLVIVADAELAGHVQHSAALRARLAGVVDANPAALDNDALHAAAFEQVARSFRARTDEALDGAHRLTGRNDGRVLVGLRQIADAAAASRVATLIVSGEPDAGDARTPDDELVEAAIRGTVLGGGDVVVADPGRLPDGADTVALLRY